MVMFAKGIALIRTPLFLWQDLTCLEQHTNTHTESLTLLTGRLSLSGFSQSGWGVRGLSSNILRDWDREGQKKRRGIGGERKTSILPVWLEMMYCCLRQKPKWIVQLCTLMPSVVVILNLCQLPGSYVGFLHPTPQRHWCRIHIG